MEKHILLPLQETAVGLEVNPLLPKLSTLALIPFTCDELQSHL